MLHEQKQLMVLMQEALEEADREDSKVENVMHLITERMLAMYKEKVEN